MVAEVVSVGRYKTIVPFSMPPPLVTLLRDTTPRTDLGRIVRAAVHFLPVDLACELLDAITRTVVCESRLELTIIRKGGRPYPLGEVSRKVVTDAGVGYVIDAFQNLVELENMKYHALGTGSTAESASDTALVTELTTEYTGNVRATGTTAEGASANIYSTVATNTLDGTPGAALREHGVMSQAATGGGVLFDRTVYAAITLSSGDALQSTYQWTLSSGG